MSSSKKIDLYRDFAAGVYQKKKSEDTVIHVNILDPALWTVSPLTFSLVQLFPLSYVNKYTLYTRIQCVWGEYVGFWASDR